MASKIPGSRIVIKFRIPPMKAVFNTVMALISMIFMVYMLQVDQWYIHVIFGSITFYANYRLIGLLARKAVIDKSSGHIIFLTPFVRKVKIDMIEKIELKTVNDPAGPSGYYIKILTKGQSSWFYFETNSERQSIYLKLLLEGLMEKKAVKETIFS